MMIVYNVTSKVDHSIVSQWLQWLKHTHIPEIIATGCFTHASVHHLLETDEEEGETFTVQYHAPSKALYNRYIDKFSAGMREKAMEKWGGGFISFRSVMEVVH